MSGLNSMFPFTETKTVDDRLSLIKDSLVETAYETEEELDAFLANLRSSIEAEAVAALAAERDRLQEELDSLYRLIVSYADLTHHVVHTNGDWRDIAKEWAGVVEKARAGLSPGTPVDVEEIR